MANPFVHIELNTSDLAKAKEFYSGLLAWKLEDTPMQDGTYTMIRVGDGVGGGMMTHPMPGAPSLWIPYILVEDVAASTKKAKALGAHVIKGVTEIPSMGAFSILNDPTGATFAMWQMAGK